MYDGAMPGLPSSARSAAFFVVATAVTLSGAACSDDGETAAGGVGGGAPPSAVTTAPVAPTPEEEATPAAALGETQPTPAGNEVTVFAVDHPATPDHRLASTPEEGAALAAVDAQLCATAGADVRAVSDADFFVLTREGRLRERWADEDDYARNPRFPISQTVRAGECVRGWITFELEADDVVEMVRWDANGNGTGPFLDWRP